MADALPLGLPALPSNLDPALRGFLTAVKEILETREGQRRNVDLERVVLVKDLYEAGLYDRSTRTFGAQTKKDSTAPSPPSGFVVFQRGDCNLVTWKNPRDEDLDFVEIWAAEDSNSLDAAKLRAVIKRPGEVYEHKAIRQTSSYTYWARACDTSWNYSGWVCSGRTPPGVNNRGGTLYEMFFGTDLMNNPGIIRMRGAIQTVGAWYYEDQGYFVGNVVVHGGFVYEAIKDNPAPSQPPGNEEFWKRYDTLAGLSSSHEARIVQAEDQIQLRATRTEVDEVLGVVESQGAALTLMADEINTKVSQSSFDVLNGEVQTISSEVSQMAGSWTVRIESLANGQRAVTGIDLTLDDGTGQSQFIVMADNFRVVANAGTEPVGLFAVNELGVYINNVLYAPGGIEASHIAAGTITADEIAAHTITADEIAAGTITATEIAAGAVTAEKIDAGAITSDKIAAEAITADMITTGVLNAGLLEENGIPISKLPLGVLLDANCGTSSCALSGMGKHLYLFTITVNGPGTVTMTPSFGDPQTYTSGTVPVYDTRGNPYYVDQTFSHVMFSTGIPNNLTLGVSTASLTFSGMQANIKSRSIVGFVRKISA